MKKLIPGEKYTLQYSGQFCHSISKSTDKNIFDIQYFVEAIFIGETPIKTGDKRNIFFVIENSTYIMFAQKKLDYVVDEKDRGLLKSIKEVEEKLKILKQKLDGKIK